MKSVTFSYCYQTLLADIKKIKNDYPFLEVGSIGKSVMGRDLFYIRLGKGDNIVMYNAAHHALEWLTSRVLMQFCFDYAEGYLNNSCLLDTNILDFFYEHSIYIVPMVNPDGVDLVLNGLDKNMPEHAALAKICGKNINYATVWQANIRGVDLNHNYDAGWAYGKSLEKQCGVNGPGPTRYSGAYAESEPESKALADFARSKDFLTTLCYHSQGEVIYYTYPLVQIPTSKLFAERLARLSGYECDNTEGMASFSGYKDWFMHYFNRPGFTIEVGRGVNPLPHTDFPAIYEKNLPILLNTPIIAKKLLR